MNNLKIKFQLALTIVLSFAAILVVGVLLFSCTEQRDNDSSASYNMGAMTGQAAPIRLNVDTTLIHLSDYFNVSSIDSVTTIPNGPSIEFIDDQVTIIATDEMPLLIPSHYWIDGQAYTILLQRSALKPYTFSFNANGKTYNSVQVKGEMNSWNVNANPLKEENGTYTTNMWLEQRDYQYTMVLNGRDVLDENNPVSIPNGLGGNNSVLSPFGQANKEPLHLITLSSDDDEIALEASRLQDAVYALWENMEIPVEQEGQDIELDIPAAAAGVERSFIRVFATAGNTLSNDVLIPLHKGAVMSSADQLNRMDKHAMVLYNAFVDRFYNGDESNDRPLNLPDVHPRADYHGGDIAGVTDKVEAGYFEELGVNTVWVSPIVKNVEGPYGKWPDPETRFSAYHGYWPISFTEIDDRMGTPEDLHELVETAHESDMNVLLDFVANHVHEEHPFYKANKEMATDLYLPDGRLNTELWDEQRLTTWFDVFLPSLRLDEPIVYETLSDSAVFWLTEYNLDGFRHDATKHVPEIFWRTLTRKIKDQVILEEDRDIYQIGETYGTRELVGSYVNNGQLDAQFDFNVYDETVNALARPDGSFVKLNDAIQASMKQFGHHHLMGNITGNQDRGRFISYAGGALRFDENAKVAGWTREVLVGDPVAYKKSELLMAMIATTPGLPVIYYGDEVGSYGGNDPDNRKMMFFDDLTDEQQAIKDVAALVLNFRNSDLPLIYGDMRTHRVDDKVFVFSRNYFDQHTIVAFNTGDRAELIEFSRDLDQEGEPEALNGSKLKTTIAGRIKFTLEPNSFEIISLK